MVKFNFKKWRKRITMVVLPVIAVSATVVAVAVSKNRASNNIAGPDFANDENKNMRRVYVLSEQNLVVPLTVSVEKKADIGEDLLQVLSLIKEGSSLMEKGYRPVLSEGVVINRLAKTGTHLILDFNNEFASYRASSELRILEALVWTVTQYPDIETVELQMDGLKLVSMPVAQTPLPAVLSRSLGINNMTITASNPYTTTTVITYYEKVINKEKVLIPLTRKVPQVGTALDTSISYVFNPTSDVDGFSKPQFLANIRPTVEPTIVDNILHVDLNHSALEDETSMSQSIFSYFYISLFDIRGVKNVNITVEGEIVQISGYDIQLNEIEVANVYYNTIQL